MVADDPLTPAERDLVSLAARHSPDGFLVELIRMADRDIGMAVGLTLALGISQLLKIVLFQVQPRDPVIFSGVAAVLVGVGMLACLVPARRATLVDPLVALRTD